MTLCEKRCSQWSCQTLSLSLAVTPIRHLKRETSLRLNRISTIRTTAYVIRPPVLFVQKKDGSLRMYVDYRGLNKVRIKDP